MDPMSHRESIVPPRSMPLPPKATTATTQATALLGLSGQQNQQPLARPLDPVVVLGRASTTTTLPSGNTELWDHRYSSYPDDSGGVDRRAQSAAAASEHPRALHTRTECDQSTVATEAAVAVADDLTSSTHPTSANDSPHSSECLDPSIASSMPAFPIPLSLPGRKTSVCDDGGDGQNLPLPVQLRTSVRFDPDQHYEKLVKAKVQVVLVLTALVRLDTPNATFHDSHSLQTPTQNNFAPEDSPLESRPPYYQAIWIELCRTEMMSMDKGCFEGHFVTVLPLQIQENYLVIGFTLLAVPPSSVQPKDLSRSPALDGLMPWAEASVAIEHFIIHHHHEASNEGRNGGCSGSHDDESQDGLGTINEEDHDTNGGGDQCGRTNQHHGASATIDSPTILQVPLVEIETASRPGLRKSKRTVATLTIVADKILPVLPKSKLKKELERTGPSFTQTYYGHSVRGTVIYGREALYESPIAFTFPQSLLKVYAENEDRVLRELEHEPNAGFAEMIQRIPTTTTTADKAAGEPSAPRLGRRTSFLEALRRGATRAPKVPPNDVHHQQPHVTASPTDSMHLNITPKLSRMGNSVKVRQHGLMAEDRQMQKMRRQQTGIHRNIKAYYERMLERLDQKMQENIKSGQGMFRRSPEKREESLQWVPINCCVQEFFVHAEGLQTNYQTTTVGAAAAHAAGLSRTHLDNLIKKAPMGMYWDKVDQGKTFKEDFHSLEQVLAESARELKQILDDNSEHQDHDRAKAIAKEIQFVNDGMVSLAATVLNDYLSPLSTEGGAKFICDEILSILVKMQEIHVLSEEHDGEGGGGNAYGDSSGTSVTSPRTPPRHTRIPKTGGFFQQPSRRRESQIGDLFTNCEPAVEDIHKYSKELFRWLELAIEHECLAIDARYVASAEWSVDRIPRDASYSQCLTSLVTAFVALLEDWWINMSTHLERLQQQKQRRSRHVHRSDLNNNKNGNKLSSNGLTSIQDEHSGLVEAEVILPLHDTHVLQDTTTHALSSLSMPSDHQDKTNGRKPHSRRSSIQSIGSNASSTASLSGSGGSHKTTRSSKRGSQRRPSTSTNPLKDDPTVDAQNKQFWDKLVHLGWLVQIESLLSTQGSELGMLLDYAVALSDIRETVQFGFHCIPVPVATPSHTSPMSPPPGHLQQHNIHDYFSPKPSASTSSIFTPPPRLTVEREPVIIEDDTIQISGRRGAITVSFGLDPIQFALLPESLQSGTSKIKVKSVMFTQGINEMQTLSNLTGKHPTQSYINEQGLSLMQDYVTQYQMWQERTASSPFRHQQPRQQSLEVVAPTLPTIGDTRTSSALSRYPTHAPRAGSDGGHFQQPLRYVSNVSLLTDWSMISASADAWSGELLVNDLLVDLEMAVLGHHSHPLDRDAQYGGHGTAPPPLSASFRSINEQEQVLATPHSGSPTTETNDESAARTRIPTSGGRRGPGLTTPTPPVSATTSSSFLGSMSFNFFSGRATKDITILSAAESLTRALGHVTSPNSSDWDVISPSAAPSSSTRRRGSTMTNATVERHLPPLWTTSHIKSCKSAKDRTSMAVTLSQVNLLRMCHDLEMSPEQRRDQDDDWQAILDAMRSEVGVRIKNVERNLKLGDFAIDLLWLSTAGNSGGHGASSSSGPGSVNPPIPSWAFPAQQQQQLPPGLNPLEYYPMAYEQPDALSTMRSLLPNINNNNIPAHSSQVHGGMVSGILNSVLDRHHELDSGPLVLIEHEDAQEPELVHPLDENEEAQLLAAAAETDTTEIESSAAYSSEQVLAADDEEACRQQGPLSISHSTPTLMSPTLFESPPPPPTLRIVKSSTGPALNPVLVTSEASSSPARSGSASVSPLLPPIHGHRQRQRQSTDGGNSSVAESLSSDHQVSLGGGSGSDRSSAVLVNASDVPQQQQYISFPDAFDEPQLRTRLARTLGFDSGGGGGGTASAADHNTVAGLAMAGHGSAPTTMDHRGSASSTTTTGSQSDPQQRSRSASPSAQGNSTGLGLGLSIGLGFGQLFGGGTSSSPSSNQSTSAVHSSTTATSTSAASQQSHLHRVAFSANTKPGSTGDHGTGGGGRPSASGTLPSSTSKSLIYTHRTTPSWSSQQSSQYQELQRREQEAMRVEKFKRGVRLMRTFSGFSGGMTNKAAAGGGGGGGDGEQEQHPPCASNGSIGSLQELERAALSSLSSSSGKTGRLERKKGKFAFNRMQYKFLPPSYRPPKRMMSDILES